VRRTPIDLEPALGQLTLSLESSILRAIERRGAVLGHKSQTQKFDGYTEAWFADSVNVQSLRELLQFVYDDE
jgi:hypothetical protein